MSASNPTHSPLFSLAIFFLISSFKLGHSIGNNTIFCPEIEKLSLLTFKHFSFKNPKNQLPSWDSEVNCCKWKGVICNNLTGHVQQLHLPNMLLDGKISPSLLNLKHLSYLDLSENDMLGGTMPSFIGSLANLEYLNLSGAGFQGKVPHTIGNLSNLRTLDLECIPDQNELAVDSLEWLTGLSQLEHLNMNSINLRKASNWPQVINSLPCLVELHFQSCSLDHMALPDYSNNASTSLSYLDLSRNYASSITILPWIFQITNLHFLDLSFNTFDGPIPSISNATKLQHLDLSTNYFNSSIPDWLFTLCTDLKFVDLSWNVLTGTIPNSVANLTFLTTLIAHDNQLSGEIPEEIANLCKMQKLDLSNNYFYGEVFENISECFLEALEDLNLENNKLSGHLTTQFGEFKSLRYLDLGRNKFSGAIPTSIGKLSSLEKLWLHGNKFTGTLPESFGLLSSLQLLYLNDNMLEGVVSEIHFANLTKLQILSASGNQLTLKVSPNWNPPFQLQLLQIASWNLGVVASEIPSWLEKQKNIVNLDLSNTGISGNIPSWIWNIPILALSHNHLHGNIHIADSTTHLDLSYNSFSGGISHFLCNTTYENYGLTLLHLGGNQLSGELPDCWFKWPSLVYLLLGNNNISGSIPESIGFLENLRSLNLYRNRLSGEIPFTMQNCTELVMMDVGDNELDGGIPTWVGTHLLQLRFLILSSNKLSGEISPEICLLNSLQILDLSNNKFSGKIPRCISNFTSMATERSLDLQIFLSELSPRAFTESAAVAIKGSVLEYGTTLDLVTNINLSKNNLSGNIPKELTSLVELRSLNLSHNRLTGSIPGKIGDMKQLESVDLSMNSLSGEIPKSVALLSFLSYLNISYNKLTGEIPKSTQLLSLEASSFIGNSLCGPPLASNCSDNGDDVEEEENDDDDKGEIEWLYVVVSVGYAVGFSAVCSALVLKRSWREAYFGLFDSIWDKIYVCVCLKFKKLPARQESG